MVPDPFDPITFWAIDSCDMTEASQAEVLTPVQQNFRLVEQVAIEHEFAARLIADAPRRTDTRRHRRSGGPPAGRAGEDQTVGLIHASTAVASVAAAARLVVRSGAALRTPLGHLWVFGGGYVDGLGKSMLTTSPTFGWCDTVAVRATFAPLESEYLATAERSLVVGYE